MNYSSLQALVPEIDLACMELDDDDGMQQHLSYWAYENGIDDSESDEWVLGVITANPGTWTSNMCRAMHGLPENEDSIRHCGLCSDYANPRKRVRARRFNAWVALPGMESPYQLHDPCPTRGLSWLRHVIYRLERANLIERRREKIPDCRQPRGWDWASRIYPRETQDE